MSPHPIRRKGNAVWKIIMRRKTYKLISHRISNIVIPALLIANTFLWNAEWASWLMFAALCALLLFQIITASYTTLYMRLQGGEKWRRYRSLYHTQLFTQRVVTIMWIALIAAVMIGLWIKY